MNDGSERKSLNDDQIAQMIEHIENLDRDSQAVAVIDLEEALTGTPMNDRPLWLRGMSHEAIGATRQQLFGSLAVPKTVEKRRGDLANADLN